MSPPPRVWFWETLTKDTNIILTQPLPSRSSLPNWRDWQTTNGKTLDLPGLLLKKKKTSAIFVWKYVLIKSPGAKLITYGHEYCWCQGFKRRGWNCSAWSHEEGCVCSLEQKMKARARNGGEARCNMMCYMMPLIFNKSATQCAGPGAGNGGNTEGLVKEYKLSVVRIWSNV